MITIRLEGFDEAIKRFENAGKSAPKAMATKMNDLGDNIRDAEMEMISQVFDRPKPQTVRNVKVSKGNASKPRTVIGFYQIYNGDEYMIPEVEGGARTMKRSEKAFGHYYVPGAGAILDEYGNMSGGQILKIMSQLQLLKGRNARMNRTKALSSVAGPQYLKLDKAQNGLAAGIYMHIDEGQGQMLVARALATKKRGERKKDIKAQYKRALERGVIPVMIFVNRAPQYRPRFPFYQVAQQVIDTEAPSMLQDVVREVL